MRLPLYIIANDDDIPLPNSKVTIVVPYEKFSLFKSKSVSLTASEGPVDKFILGIANKTCPWGIMENPCEQMLNSVLEVGVVCRIEDMYPGPFQDRAEEDNTDIFVELAVESRVYIRAIQVNPDELGQEEAQVEVDYINEEFMPGEEEVVDQIQNVVDIILNHSEIFDNEIIHQLSRPLGLINKLDIIAGSQLRNPADKVHYLQLEDNYKRFDIVMTALNKSGSTPIKRRRSKAKYNKPKRIMKKGSSRFDLKGADSDSPSQARNLSLNQKLDMLPLSDEVKDQIQNERERLESIPKSSSEYSMVFDYLTWITNIPWGKNSYKDFPLADLTKNLNETHHGLEDVKEHLLEHMAIEKLKGGSSGSVLCFVGPPGTGKTSIAKQIAAASNRPLQRFALGSLKDEAELRGHRRTYVAAKPGRLITGLKQAKSMTPLFLLDEIDKINTNGQGDPTAALLEILDPEQNSHFIDRYLEVPVDLSKVLFVCTANDEKNIPPALRDRIEIIRFRNYTKEERSIILRNFIVKKSLEEYCLDTKDISIEDEVLDNISDIVQVRKMEKLLKKLLRMAAVQILVHDKKKVVIDTAFTKGILKIKSKQTVGF